MILDYKPLINGIEDIIEKSFSINNEVIRRFLPSTTAPDYNTEMFPLIGAKQSDRDRLNTILMAEVNSQRSDILVDVIRLCEDYPSGSFCIDSLHCGLIGVYITGRSIYIIPSRFFESELIQEAIDNPTYPSNCYYVFQKKKMR